MPLYEYQCDSCGHRFEALQKFSDPPLATCPKCGEALRKLLAAPAFQLKGTGWYVTDFAKKDGSSASGTAGKSSESQKSDAGSASKTGEAPASGGASQSSSSGSSGSTGSTGSTGGSTSTSASATTGNKSST